VAVWLEAHFQDPAEFRRAEDSGSLARFVQLSPAALFLVALPLLIFIAMHGSIAGEREDGTFRQLIASGVSGRDLFYAKAYGAIRLILPLSLSVFLLAAVVALVATEASVTADVLLRVLGLLLLYLIYLVALVLFAIGVSALFRSRQASFLALVCVWAVTAVLVPRLAADAGRSIYPQPDARKVSAQLRAASDIYYADKGRQEQIKQDVLAEYGIEKIEDLPIDYGAYVLQISEEMSEPEFERLYQDIADRHRQQNAVIRAFSLLSPQLPAAALSRALAGTDSIHQERFLAAAESHRREMIRLLNEDYMFNAGSAGYSYTADEALWQRFSDFEHQQPRISDVWDEYVIDVLLLLLWLGGALIFAQRLVLRAYQAEGD
jgi:ABC-2 type transport system permease protein